MLAGASERATAEGSERRTRTRTRARTDGQCAFAAAVTYTCRFEKSSMIEFHGQGAPDGGVGMHGLGRYEHHGIFEKEILVSKPRVLSHHSACRVGRFDSKGFEEQSLQRGTFLHDGFNSQGVVVDLFLHRVFAAMARRNIINCNRFDVGFELAPQIRQDGRMGIDVQQSPEAGRRRVHEESKAGRKLDPGNILQRDLVLTMDFVPSLGQRRARSPAFRLEVTFKRAKNLPSSSVSLARQKTGKNLREKQTGEVFVNGPSWLVFIVSHLRHQYLAPLSTFERE